MRLKHKFKPIFIEKDMKTGLLRSISCYCAYFADITYDILGRSIVDACFCANSNQINGISLHFSLFP